MISRVTMRKVGLSKYLQDGKRADSNYTRTEKDKVVPLYGSLNLFKKVEDYCNEKKSWSSNYEHITISFSDEDVKILEDKTELEYIQSLNSIVLDMIKHRTSGYDIDNEVIAYAELHDPKIKEERNSRTGEIQKRRKHIHIGISYLNPLSDTKLQTTFYNNSYISDTIDKYIAKKNGLTCASAIEPSDRDVDKSSQMTINRNILKEATKDFKTKEELYKYFSDNSIEFDFTNKKTKTKPSNVYVYNNKGGKIHLRGKDFTNIEIMHNHTISDDTKISNIKELKTKSLKELGDVLEKYYKTNRIPLIEKRRSIEDKKILNDIYEKNNNILNDKINSFTSLQEKIFYKHYNHLISSNLKGYDIDVENDIVKLSNKNKGIEVVDYGDKITANAGNGNLSEKVKLMVDIAIAKGWDLSSMTISGDKDFKKEAHKQIAKRISMKTVTKKNKSLSLTVLETVNKKIDERPTTPTQQLQKENEEKAKNRAMNDDVSLSMLKQNLKAKRILDYAVDKYKLNRDDYELTADNKINNKNNRQKPKNVIDFLQKEMHLSSSEAITICRNEYKEQPLSILNTKKEEEFMPLKLSICKDTNINALNDWEQVEINSYEKLASCMKQYPYSTAQFDNGYRNSKNATKFNNLLIYDIDNDEDMPQLSLTEAENILKEHNIGAMILASKSHNKDKKGRIAERYRIMIPVKKALSDNTDKKTYVEFQRLTARALKIDKYVDNKALNDKSRFYYKSLISAEPTIIKSDKVMNIEHLEKRAIENIAKEKQQKEAEQQRVKEIKANAKKYLTVNKEPSNNLTYANVDKIIDLDIQQFINYFEQGAETYQEGDYHYMKTANRKYSIIDDNLAHNFKNGVTYNVLTYLQEQFQTDNLNQIARELEKITGDNFIEINLERVKDAVIKARAIATNDKSFEEVIRKSFTGVSFVKFKGSLSIADVKINLKDIGMTNKDIVRDLQSNRNLAEQQNKELEQEKKAKKQVQVQVPQMRM